MLDIDKPTFGFNDHDSCHDTDEKEAEVTTVPAMSFTMDLSQTDQDGNPIATASDVVMPVNGTQTPFVPDGKVFRSWWDHAVGSVSFFVLLLMIFIAFPLGMLLFWFLFGTFLYVSLSCATAPDDCIHFFNVVRHYYE